MTFTPSISYIFFASLLGNSFPWSWLAKRGGPYLVSMCRSIARATVSALLFGIGAHSTYPDVVSAIRQPYLFPFCQIGKGPNKSIATCSKTPIGHGTTLSPLCSWLASSLFFADTSHIAIVCSFTNLQYLGTSSASSMFDTRCVHQRKLSYCDTHARFLRSLTL